MKPDTNEAKIVFGGIPHTKHVILADVNIPYKFSIDRKNNNLFFCINTEEFLDESFQSVVLNLDTGLASIIPGIRNGFASAVDQTTGDVYLGGSNGIFKYNYSTNHVVHPALVHDIDIFDMYFNKTLYFVDTRSQDLHLYKNNKTFTIVETEGKTIQHFVIDVYNDLYYVSPSGLYVIRQGSKSATLLDTNDMDIRGATTDAYGSPYFIAKDGIYSFEKESKQMLKVLSVKNGNGLAFDMNNRLIYCEGRSIIALNPS